MHRENEIIGARFRLHDSETIHELRNTVDNACVHRFKTILKKKKGHSRMNKQTIRTILLVLAGVSAILAALAMIIGGEMTMINAAIIFLAVIVMTALVTRMRGESRSR
jgi:hypothetical protein